MGPSGMPEEQATSASEGQGLLAAASPEPHGDPEQQPPAAAARGGPQHRRLIAAAAAALLLAAAATAGLRRGVRCRGGAALVVAGDTLPFVSLAEADAEGLVSLEEARGNEGALLRWLEATEAAGDAAGVAGARGDGKLDVAAQEAVREAMNTSDPVRAKQIARQSMRQAVSRWRARRKALKKFLKVRGKLQHKRGRQGKAQVASCVFNVLQASSGLAAVAVNLNDVARTCNHITPERRNSSSTALCLLNLLALWTSIATVGGSLALASNVCADTLIPNVDRMCAAAVQQILALLPQLAGSAILIAEACRPGVEARYHVHAGATASNIGVEGTPGDFQLFGTGARRLQASGPDAGGEVAEWPAGAPAGGAPPRQLLLGGGMGADAAFCGIDISTAMWFLAQAGLAMNTAVNKKAGALCPPRNLFGKKNPKYKGKLYRWAQAGCVVPISNFIFAMAGAVFFLEFTAVHCTDTLNVRAVCGAGIDGLVLAMGGLTQGGTGSYLACNQFQKPKLHKLLKTVQKLDFRTGGAITSLVDGTASGRRLGADMEEQAAELRRRFKTPDEAWMSIGFDLQDPNAQWRLDHEAAGPRRADPAALAGLVGAEPEPGSQPRGSLRGEGQDCK